MFQTIAKYIVSKRTSDKNTAVNEGLTNTEITTSKVSFLIPMNAIKSLLACQLLNLVLLAFQLNVIYLIFAVCALFLQWFSYRQHYLPFQLSPSVPIKPLAVLPKWLVVLLAITGSIVLAATGRELGLLMTMVHLLCFAYSLKTFEISTRKDIFQLVILGVFVSASSLIFLQSIYFSVLVISIVFINFIIVLYFFTPKLALKTQLKTLFVLLAYSVPFAIVLFVVFPKISPFWQVPNVKSSKVGMSDEVKIGDISQLALSNELAFRVSFNSQVPDTKKLYWRSLVLDGFDGTTWRQAIKERYDRQGNSNNAVEQNVLDDPNIDIQGEGFSYQVITEPSYQSWLFAINLATSTQSNIGQRKDYSLYYKGVISQKLSYEVTSFPDVVLAKDLSLYQRRLNTQVNVNRNPRLLAKGAALRQQFSNNGQLINNVLVEFNRDRYRYTLRPPSLNVNGDSLDEFYFDTKAGFCEHYASAFTYLMRAAGIPARMVVGYLGGEFNPNANYLSVYQRDAHAWSEVWLEGVGWQRVDPTGAVNPDRVERGFTDNLLKEHEELSSGFFTRPSVKAMLWLMKIKHQFDALDYQWTRWVIGYSGQQQTDVLKYLKLAFTNLKNIIYGLIVIGLTFVIYVAIRKLVTKQQASNIWVEQYQNILRLLAVQELSKTKSQTAMMFAKSVAKQRPDLAEDFSVLSACFCKLEYQIASNDEKAKKQAEQKMLESYKKLIKKIKYKKFFSLATK